MPASPYVHSAGLYPASSVAIPPHVMRHVLCPLYGILSPYARFPPTPVGLTLGATPPSSFLPFPSFDISICRISLSRNLRCPARPALSCAREFRERSSLLLLWARGIGGLAARTLVPLVFFCVPSGEYSPPRPVRVQCGCISLPDLGGLPAVPPLFFPLFVFCLPAVPPFPKYAYSGIKWPIFLKKSPFPLHISKKLRTFASN